MKDDFWDEFVERANACIGNASFVNYLPFIGSKYFDSKCRILVLGESHYGKRCCKIREDLLLEGGMKKNGYISSLTIDSTVGSFLWCDWICRYGSAMQYPYPIGVTDEMADSVGDQKMGFRKNFQRTANLIRGVQSRNRCSNYIWDHLAFYNYFQRIVGEKSQDHKWVTKELIDQSKEALIEVLDKLQPRIVIVWGSFKTEWRLNEVEGLYAGKISFIHIMHPSCRTSTRKGNTTYGWEDSYGEIKKKWAAFLSDNKIDTSDVVKRHPHYDTVRNLYKRLKELNAITSFNCYLGQCSLCLELYSQKKDYKQRKQHGFIESKENGILLEIVYDDHGCATIRFFMSNHSAPRAYVYAKLLGLNFDSCGFQNNVNGHFLVSSYPSGTGIEEISKDVVQFLQKMEEAREKLAAKQITTLKELGDSIKDFYSIKRNGKVKGSIFNFYPRNIPPSATSIICELFLKKNRKSFVASDNAMYFEMVLDDLNNVHFNFYTRNHCANNARQILLHRDFFDIKDNVIYKGGDSSKIRDVMTAQKLDAYCLLNILTFMETMVQFREKYPD